MVLSRSAQTLDEVLLELRSLGQVTEAQLHDDWRTRRVIAQGSPILRFEAASGRLLCCRDAGRRATFVSLTAREYEESIAMVQRALAVRALAQADRP